MSNGTVVDDFLNAIAAQDAEALAAILAPDVHLEFPYDEGSRDHIFDGRDAFVSYFAGAFDYLQPIVFSHLLVHESGNGQTLVAEFRGQSAWVTDQRPYHQRYIAVFELDDDRRISTYREYRNPLAY